MRTGRGMTLVLVLALGVILAGCATAPTGGGPITQVPRVTLDRVEVASYFPYAAPPARVPLGLAFIFEIENPGDTTVLLEDFKFTVAFEAAPGEYFPLATPISYERLYTPPRTTNELRVVTVLDSMIVPGTLAVTSGYRLGALNLKAPDVVKNWWEKIGDFAYQIKVSEGTATFSSGDDSKLVTFEGIFPKK
ncbi:MAG TPA: hypothetical protein VED18_18220 [Candidatus Sulfotelmatobacter sp.]|nr:hypothetical protein [Candidatus Sulfotelmatobacter sp.]